MKVLELMAFAQRQLNVVAIEAGPGTYGGMKDFQRIQRPRNKIEPRDAFAIENVV